MNITQTERSILIQSILESDARYLDKLLQRRERLRLEVQGLDIQIHKKVLEIQALEKQIDY